MESVMNTARMDQQQHSEKPADRRCRDRRLNHGLIRLQSESELRRYDRRVMVSTLASKYLKLVSDRFIRH